MKGLANPLAVVLSAVVGRCAHCGCAGDTCSVPEGGKCELQGELQNHCSAPACARQHYAGLPQKQRSRRRERLFPKVKGRAA